MAATKILFVILIRVFGLASTIKQPEASLLASSVNTDGADGTTPPEGGQKVLGSFVQMTVDSHGESSLLASSVPDDATEDAFNKAHASISGKELDGVAGASGTAGLDGSDLAKSPEASFGEAGLDGSDLAKSPEASFGEMTKVEEDESFLTFQTMETHATMDQKAEAQTLGWPGVTANQIVAALPDQITEIREPPASLMTLFVRQDDIDHFTRLGAPDMANQAYWAQGPVMGTVNRWARSPEHVANLNAKKKQTRKSARLQLATDILEAASKEADILRERAEAYHRRKAENPIDPRAAEAFANYKGGNSL